MPDHKSHLLASPTKRQTSPQGKPSRPELEVEQLVRFGNTLREREGWKSPLQGLDAARYFLMLKYHWTPHQLDQMSIAQLRFALSEELQYWSQIQGRTQL